MGHDLIQIQIQIQIIIKNKIVKFCFHRKLLSLGCIVKCFAEEDCKPYSPDRVVYMSGPSRTMSLLLKLVLDVLIEPSNNISNKDPIHGSKQVTFTWPAAAPRQGTIHGSTLGLPDMSSYSSNNSGTKRRLDQNGLDDSTPKRACQQPAGSPTNPNDPPTLPQGCLTSIYLNAGQADLIIGQNGSTINQIRTLTGARVNIDEQGEASMLFSTKGQTYRCKTILLS